MNPNDKPDSAARRLALLKQLEAKGLARASDLLGEGSKGDARRRDVPLSDLFPDAQRLASAADGAALWRLRSSVAIDGRPTRQGYVCPAEPWSGPPDPAGIAALTGEGAWAGLPLESVLYLDTETTGLATGAGTVAFLVGLGRFDPDGGRFTLDQYYMDDFAAEPLLVEAVDRELRAAGALVTYNGGAFDLPLLASRWAMQRRSPRFPELHLDLLHYARRLWRRILPDCSLGTVERHILGIGRLSDVPGMLIPTIYLEALRGLRPERLVPVFDHHAQDVLSMGALVSLFLAAVDQPDRPDFARAEVQWGLARLAESRGDRAGALVRMEAAVLAARQPDLEWRLALHLARAYRRVGRLGDALAIWRARAPQCRPGRLEPLVELAKHAEHVLKDVEEARRWTEQALTLVQSHADLAWYGVAGHPADSSAGVELAALQHRLARHERKLRRRGEAGTD